LLLAPNSPSAARSGDTPLGIVFNQLRRSSWRTNRVFPRTGKGADMSAKILSAAAFVVALAAVPTSAATFTLTFTGKVVYDQEYNALGVSGYGTDTFVGDAYTVTFDINTANGIAYIYPPFDQGYYGGSFAGVSSPVLSSTATFGGQSVSSDYYSYVFGSSPRSCCRGLEEAYDSAANFASNYLVLFVSGYPNFQSGTGYEGYADTFFEYQNPFSYGEVEAEFLPEPSTCAMMLLGFAGLSFAGYRRARAGRRLEVLRWLRRRQDVRRLGPS
jgi:hypothetical protein